MTNALKVRTSVKAGGIDPNHSEAQALRVRTSVKAGSRSDGVSGGVA